MEAYNMNRAALTELLEKYELEKERIKRDARMKQLIAEEEAKKKALIEEATSAKSLIRDLLDDDEDEENANAEDAEIPDEGDQDVAVAPDAS